MNILARIFRRERKPDYPMRITFGTWVHCPVIGCSEMTETTTRGAEPPRSYSVAVEVLLPEGQDWTELHADRRPVSDRFILARRGGHQTAVFPRLELAAYGNRVPTFEIKTGDFPEITR